MCTHYSTFHELAALAYGDQTKTHAIPTYIEFDKDGEFVAVGMYGVDRKIKVRYGPRLTLYCHLVPSLPAGV